MANRLLFQGMKGCKMVRYALIALSISVFLGFGKPSFALDPDDEMGLTPDQLQQLRNTQDNATIQRDKDLAEELKRRRDHPYWNCVFLGNIIGKDMYEAKSISIKLGATNIQWTNVTNYSASGNAYRCPAQ